MGFSGCLKDQWEALVYFCSSVMLGVWHIHWAMLNSILYLSRRKTLELTATLTYLFIYIFAFETLLIESDSYHVMKWVKRSSQISRSRNYTGQILAHRIFNQWHQMERMLKQSSRIAIIRMALMDITATYTGHSQETA